jgi:hypothetical protein
MTTTDEQREQRLSRLREVIREHGIVTDTPGVSSTDDLAPYLSGDEPIRRWCAVTQGGEFTYAYPECKSEDEARSLAECNAADSVWAESPVAIVDLDTGDEQRPAGVVWMPPPSGYRYAADLVELRGGDWSQGDTLGSAEGDTPEAFGADVARLLREHTARLAKGAAEDGEADGERYAPTAELNITLAPAEDGAIRDRAAGAATG